MLCEAESDSVGDTGRGPGQKNSAHVGRSANHPLANLLAWKSSQSKMQFRRQNGYEDLNLFAWTSV
jgi:hypothetical protein